jgi:hypothetical protein
MPTLPPNQICILVATLEAFGARETLLALAGILGEYVLGERSRDRLPQQLVGLSGSARLIADAALRLTAKP